MNESLNMLPYVDGNNHKSTTSTVVDTVLHIELAWTEKFETLYLFFLTVGFLRFIGSF